MKPLRQNPFSVTKAVDFSDAEIESTWVDLPDPGGFRTLLDPTSPMPIILLSGKGSGRTHIMRYFSYPLQKRRAAADDTLAGLSRDGYVGIFFRCEGLNAGRFQGKGQPVEVWDAIFPYYLDLWLAQLTIGVLQDAVGERESFKRVEAEFCAKVLDIFDRQDFGTATTLTELVKLFRQLQRAVDVAVNNVAVTRKLDVAVRATRGRLVFEIPQAAREILGLGGIQFVYLIDELENLTTTQQRYVNTLVREKQLPVTLRVGSRSFGMRTFETLSAGEVNRHGAEHHVVSLDDRFAARPGLYPAFARRLVTRRLLASGRVPAHDEIATVQKKDAQLREALGRYFATIQSSKYEETATEFLRDRPSLDRSHMTALRTKLDGSARRKLAPGVESSADVDAILADLRVQQYPLLEKVNVFLLYQDWASRRDLRASAKGIGDCCRALVDEGQASKRHTAALDYYKGDLLAQMLRDGKQRQRYLGLETFIDMSARVPRNLMVILKCVHDWAVFNGERPFEDLPISARAQNDGVIEASNWFLEDARGSGPDAEMAYRGVERLAQLFRRLRFSDKPVESSLVTFSFVEADASEPARRAVRVAHDGGMLVKVRSGHKDRNKAQLIEKYQLSPMLCPRYELPLARRGVVELSQRELEAVFAPEREEEYEEVTNARLRRMTAPFIYDGELKERTETTGRQVRLPGVK